MRQQICKPPLNFSWRGMPISAVGTNGVEAALPIQQNANPGVTICLCGTEFPKAGKKKFCSDTCRQRACRARKDPAARAAKLQGLKNQRLNRRWAWMRRKLRHKYLGRFGYSGPSANGVPSLGMLDLHRFSKELEQV
jgi:hypothetical protein